MKIKCVWEHNGSDTLLYSIDFPGAFTRGETKETALLKMPNEIYSYCKWAGFDIPKIDAVEIGEDAPCTLAIADADSDVLFESERAVMTAEEYQRLKQLALKSAKDFLSMYESIPDKNYSPRPARKTFYGQAPRTADEMYLHTKNVNEYYFGEIGIRADNEGNIFECRARGFAELEEQNNFLENMLTEGSYGELWTLRKMLRRFIWHDRIHAKAMYMLALKIGDKEKIENPFFF